MAIVHPPPPLFAGEKTLLRNNNILIIICYRKYKSKLYLETNENKKPLYSNYRGKKIVRLVTAHNILRDVISIKPL